MTHTEGNTEFRCPFQIKGEKEGSIVEVHLSDEAASRMSLIAAAFKHFHEVPNTMSIRFHLPDSLTVGCASLEDLKAMILPYQAEILAGEIDYRLAPFFPYQMGKHSREEVEALFRKVPYKFATTDLLGKVMKSHAFPLESVTDISEWILTMMCSAILLGHRSPSLKIVDEGHNSLLSISPGSISVHPEDFEQYTGPGNDRRNCFGIVTNPFYPKSFGRYTDDIQIVMSRMKDFTVLSSEQRRKVREKCNSVYKAHGVKINDVEEDKQPDGVWIPEYVAVIA